MAFKSFGISFGHMRDNPSDVRILEQPASLQMNIVGARVSMVN